MGRRVALIGAIFKCSSTIKIDIYSWDAWIENKPNLHLIVKKGWKKAVVLAGEPFRVRLWRHSSIQVHSLTSIFQSRLHPSTSALLLSAISPSTCNKVGIYPDPCRKERSLQSETHGRKKKLLTHNEFILLLSSEPLFTKGSTAFF